MNEHLKKIPKALAQIRIAIVRNSYIWGTTEELLDYLKGKAKEIIVIKHPFYESKEVFSRVLVINKNSSKVSNLKPRLHSTILDYFLDFVSSLWYALIHGRFDVFIGADPLNSLVGLVLRKLGLATSVIYYAVDYSPKRFESELVNWIYHYIEALCAVKCDYTWNLSTRYVEARESKLRRLGFQKRGNQVLVRIPVHESRVRDFTEIKHHGVIFSGSLRKEAGLDLILQAVRIVGPQIPDLEVAIAGEGSIKEELTLQVINQRLERYIKISDYIPSRQKFIDFLSSYAVGLAIYDPSRDSYTAYADVSKVKNYLACGLPVILSRHSYNAKEVEQYNAGILVDFDSADIARAIHELLDNQQCYLKYRQNALNLSKEFNSEKIFSEAFEQILNP